MGSNAARCRQIPSVDRSGSSAPAATFTPVRRLTSLPESGQTSAEYVLIVAAIAVGCALGALLLSGAITNLFGSSARPMKSAPFRPPVRPAPLQYPATADECVDGGWRDYPQFADEAACTDYVDGLSP